MCKKNGRFFYTLFYFLTFCFILILVKKTFCCYQHFFLLYKTGKASYFIGKLNEKLKRKNVVI